MINELISRYGKGYIISGEYITDCVYFSKTHCKATGLSGQKCLDCDCRLRKSESININYLSKPMKRLLSKCEGEMIFIENDSTEFSDEDLDKMIDEMIFLRPILYDYIKIDNSRQGEALITVYQGINSILYDHKEFKKLIME